jgi:predicted DCC family thiol-disulfide oxidoreductase YuxK
MRILIALAIMFSSYALTRALSMKASPKLSSLSSLSSPKNVILYDGVCNFCNKWVDLLLSIDTSSKFKFTALQSEDGKQLLSMIGKNPNDLSTVVYIRNLNQVYFKSDVPVQVLIELKGVYKPLGKVFKLVPTVLRTPLYDLVASNRYSFLGKREDCRCSAGARDSVDVVDSKMEI